MTLDIISGFAGGLGLFLLGMRLITQGLKLAAGPALRHILARWTGNPLRGMFSGFLITALVQSSSAVTVAVIGFANAGLMSLKQTIGVIYGSNIGTTVTGWIVAAVGLDLDIKALALPLIALGAALRLTGGDSRRVPFGDALAGFGLFFLGISILQGAFHGLETLVDLQRLTSAGGWCLPVSLGVGALLTVLMQSSSAAMALVLTAAMSGAFGMDCAAAAVVGTNIGTTSTAAFSVIGATPNAKKVAAAHILFNVVTALAALALLPLLVGGARIVAHAVGMTGPASILALFHTGFNLLGTALLLPFTKRLVRLLDTRLTPRLPEARRPRYLDKNILNTPSLAVDALFMELGRIGEMARLMAQHALASDCSAKGLMREHLDVVTLMDVVREYIVRIQRTDLSENAATGLSKGLRVLQYYQSVAEIVGEQHQAAREIGFTAPANVAEARDAFKAAGRDLLNLAHTPCVPEFSTIERDFHALTDVYHGLKEALLHAGAVQAMDVDEMVRQLEYYSRIRRMIEQAVKGTFHWSGMRDIAHVCRNAGPDNEYTWKTAS